MSYKVSKAIEVTYQAPVATAGLDDVKMDVYDESHAIDVAKGVAAMTEIGATGRYYATFTPDAEGEWQVHIDSITKPGKVIKQFTVVAHDVDSVGDDVAAVDGKVDTVDGKVDTVDGKVTTAIAGVATIDGKVDALNDVSTGDIDSALATYDGPTKAEMDSKIDSISFETGPMLG